MGQTMETESKEGKESREEWVEGRGEEEGGEGSRGVGKRERSLASVPSRLTRLMGQKMEINSQRTETLEEANQS